MYFISKNIKLYYEKYGSSNKVILILPGWGNTRRTFDFIINSLKEDYTIYIFDYPNFGMSPIPNKVLTIYDYSDIINDFIKKNKLEIYSIICHSFGGRISSILLSKNNLNVNKLILMDVAGIKRFSIRKIIKQNIYKFLKVLTNLTPKCRKEAIKRKLLLKFSASDYKDLTNEMRETFKNIVNEDLRKYYKLINIPTLIIWGDNDMDTPLKDAKYLNKVIKDSGLIIYKGGGHFSYLNFPYRTNLILKEFLNEKKKAK